MRYRILLLALISLLFYNCGQSEASENHVFLFIGDGMGPQHETAASYYLTGVAEQLSFQDFPFKTQVNTRSANNTITDSAAAATAFATGYSANNGVISQAIPGSGNNLTTIMDYATDQAYLTGVITTTFLTHATPAAFLAHAADRNDYTTIGALIPDSSVALLMGGGENGLAEAALSSRNYVLTSDLSEFATSPANKLAFLYGSTHLPYRFDASTADPSLSSMTSAMLSYLDHNTISHSLIVLEGGRIDHASHANDLPRMIQETLDFSEAIKQVQSWADQHQPATKVTILVVADHETGGLQIQNNNGINHYPTVLWATIGHTDNPVNLYVYSTANKAPTSIIENESIYEILNQHLEL